MRKILSLLGFIPALALAAPVTPITDLVVTNSAQFSFVVSTPLWADSSGKLIPVPNQSANTVFAGPASGSAGAPGFRALVVGDMPITFAPDPILMIAQANGSSIYCETIPAAYGLGQANGFALGTAYYVAIWLPAAKTVHGVGWVQQTNGNYTANNFNGVGLYTVSGGVLTQVALSANTAGTWSQGTGFQKLAFSSTYSAAAGVYYIGIMYSSSAHVTNPVIASASGFLNVANLLDMTNSLAFTGNLASQTALASPTQTFSSLTPSASFWLALY